MRGDRDELWGKKRAEGYLFNISLPTTWVCYKILPAHPLRTSVRPAAHVKCQCKRDFQDRARMESACSVNSCTALLHLKAVTGPISKGTDTELRAKRKREHIPTYSKALRGTVGHRHWHLGLTSG